MDDRFKNQWVHFDPELDMITPDSAPPATTSNTPLHSDPGKSRYHRAPLKFDHGLSQAPRPKQERCQHRRHQPCPTPNSDQSPSTSGSRMHAERGGISDNEDKDRDDEGMNEDDNDDVFEDDILPATQPPELPSLLSRVFDVESPDNDIPDIPCNRGDPNHSTIPDGPHHLPPDPNVERPSHIQTQVDWLTFNSHSHTSPIRLTAQALIIGRGLHSTYDPMTPLEPTYVGNPIDIDPEPTQFTLGSLTT